MGYASIFNDVIGPVMRGPSSSHIAAASRMGQLIRMSTQQPITRVTVGFDPRSSLATTHDGQGSDLGLVSGLLGIPLEDPRIGSSFRQAEEKGMQVQYIIEDYQNDHPNYYHIAVETAGTRHVWEAISTGGGMIQVQKVDGFAVDLRGDAYELLAVVPQSQLAQVENQLADLQESPDMVWRSAQEGKVLLHIRRSQPVSPAERERIAAIEPLEWFCVLEPVLPIAANPGSSVPFSTAAELLAYAQEDQREMWQLAALYESQRGGISQEEVFQRMKEILRIMKNSVEQGVQGTEYADRILGPQAYRMDHPGANAMLLPSELLNRVIRNITAIMEVKSSMGVIVAAPTAGSCGCLPGTLTAVGDVLGLEEDTVVKGLLAAGLVGIFVSQQATFSAEVAGCQAECGVGSAMAAAGLAQIMGGTVKQCVDAASVALQNVTGLVCDPVANRVEVPCLGKNIMGGVNAIASANMVLAGFEAVIPLDETIRAMYDIGLQLPSQLRCTCGGLGKTPTAHRIEKTLQENQGKPQAGLQ